MWINKYCLLNFIWRNKIRLESIERCDDGSTVIYRSCVSGLWQKLFLDKFLKIDFGVNVSNVPDSVLVIPFLTNILPIVWLCNAIVEIEAIDRDFYDCIVHVKQGYENMYKSLRFLGEVKAKKIESHSPHIQKHASALFFSAGVDSYSTYIDHQNEKPILITLRGSDVDLDDNAGWQKMMDRQQFMTNNFGLECVSISSNFRKVINERKLGRIVKKTRDGWWHGFQHGIAIIGHAAPLSFLKGVKNLYIASSFKKSLQGHVSCASDPSIDNNVAFVGTNVIHDGCEDRFHKVEKIVNFYRMTGMVFPLHVCWQSRGGGNCSFCEKCVRTMLAIYACGIDPRIYGFDPNLVNVESVRRRIRESINYENEYKSTMEELRKRYTEKNIENWARWVLSFDS